VKFAARQLIRGLGDEARGERPRQRMLTEKDVARALANGRIGGEFDPEGILW
jgi:hypothetical protein